jgi:hypothetical protein
MKKKDRENEYIGIAAIVLIIIFALTLLYYFYSDHTFESHGTSNTHIPVESPAPPTDNINGVH